MGTSSVQPQAPPHGASAPPRHSATGHQPSERNDTTISVSASSHKIQLPQITQTPNSNSSSGKGGGSLRSIDQKFEVNPCNGSLSTSLPLKVTSSRGGLHPLLELSYNSGSGSSPFGLGWHLGLGSITRKTSLEVPKYDASDIFILSGSDDLVEEGNEFNTTIFGKTYRAQRYRPRVQGSDVLRIERLSSQLDENDVFWRTISSANTTSYYGRSDESRILAKSESRSNRIFSWLLCEIHDASGNAMQICYKAENDQGIVGSSTDLPSWELNRDSDTRSRARYIKSVKYGNSTPSRDLETWKIQQLPDESKSSSEWWMFEVVFDYGEHDLDTPTTEQAHEWHVRSDPISTYSCGFEIRSYRLCRRILMFHHFPDKLSIQDCLVSSYEIEYDELPTGSFMKLLVAKGHIWDQVAKAYISESSSPCRFEYTKPASPDLIELQRMKPASLQNIPGNKNNIQAQWIDLHGEGSPGLLVRSEGTWRYQRNQAAVHSDSESEHSSDDGKEHIEGHMQEKGDPFGPVQDLGLRPSLAKDANNTHFEDLDGNGLQDLVVSDSNGRLVGYFECLAENEWTDFKEFPVSTNVNTIDKSIRRLDLTGNGRNDIMSDSARGPSWTPSLGKNGFEPSRRCHALDNETSTDQDGIRAVVSGASEDYSRTFVYVADANGDGLVDIVRISNGRVSYIPNLGHGNFGHEVIMGNAPCFDKDNNLFNFKRLHLMDLDGSGTVDMIYLTPGGGAMAYYNLCGNSWSDAVPITRFPQLDDLSSVFTLDLLGNGTSCLCWLGPEDGSATGEVVISYLDLNGGVKPHLMKHWTNGIGLEVSVKYCPSTKFYLHDERHNRPWPTRLPFPVQTVGRLVERDAISGLVSTSKYRYHDGYYDGREREFRGFGMVENWRTEKYPVRAGMRNMESPTTYTKLWFHTGALETGVSGPLTVTKTFGTSSEVFCKLPPGGLQNDELWDAYRALKGKQLRAEIYGEDGSSRSGTPYTVSESSYDVEMISSASWELEERFATFRVQPSETKVTTYERDSQAPPRIHREVFLEMNQYGDSIKSAQIIDGLETSSLTDPDARAAQARHYLTFVTNSYTDAIEEDQTNFYKPQIASSQTTYVSLPSAFNIDMILEKGLSGLQSAEGFAIQKGEKTRTLYKSGLDVTKVLPLGSFEAFSTVDSVYQLAMDKAMIQAVYQNGDFAFQFDEGTSFFRDVLCGKSSGFSDLESDSSAWLSSGSTLFHDGKNKDGTLMGTQEYLIKARRSFFTPQIFKDALGNASEVHLDNNFLLVEEATDAVGNTTKATNDYRVMLPCLVTDPNQNRMENMYGPFGDVTGTAKMGKASEPAMGDSLEGLILGPSDEALLAFVNDPNFDTASKWLGGAGSRTFVYRTPAQTSDPPSSTVPMFQLHLAGTEHIHNRNTMAQEGRGGSIFVDVTYMDGRGNEYYRVKLVDWDAPPESRWCVTAHNVHGSTNASLFSLLPYFAPDLRFRAHTQASGPFQVRFFDASGRQVGTLHPNHAWDKTQFHTWSTVAFDAGDTCAVTDPATDPDVGFFFRSLDKSTFLPSWTQLRSQPERDALSSEAVQKSLAYADKPSTTHFDGRGNPLMKCDIFQGGYSISRKVYDVAGRKTCDIDALGRKVEEVTLDYLGQCLAKRTMDSGRQLHLLDALGNVILERDGRGSQRRTVRDAANRPTETWLRAPGNDKEIKWSQVSYGDSLTDGHVKNLRGQIYETCDQSGRRKNIEFDFEGRCLASERSLATEYRSILDWTTTPKMEEKVYTTLSVFDALGRTVKSTDALGHVSTTSYNLLSTVKSIYSAPENGGDAQAAACHIAQASYAADGVPVLISYGNSTRCLSQYDDNTRELVRKTIRRKDGAVLEDLEYRYDCLGRISTVTNHAPKTDFVHDTRKTTSKNYWYDDLGRLDKATGRESVDAVNNVSRSFQQASPSSPLARETSSSPGQSTKQCDFTEFYTYDLAGNLASIEHESHSPSVAPWTRTYEYKEPSGLEPKKFGNRLSSTKVGDLEESYGYDYDAEDAGSVGCMTSMTGYSRLGWDLSGSNKLRYSARQRVNAGLPETTWYVYDGSGRRVRKVTDRSTDSDDLVGAGEFRKTKEVLFLGGCEITSTYDGHKGDVQSIMNASTVHAGGGTGGKPLASIETPVLQKSDAADPSKRPLQKLVRYHMSPTIELDDNGLMVSHEDYSAFGASVLLAGRSNVEAPRKYRFAAYQRDSETGLYACGARYYAPWLGRWISPDPLGTVDGPNLYAYVGNDPVNWEDSTGTERKRRNAIKDWNAQFKTNPDNPKSADNYGKFVLEVEKALSMQESWYTRNIVRKEGYYGRLALKVIFGEVVGIAPFVGPFLKAGVNMAHSYNEKLEKKKKERVQRLKDMRSSKEFGEGLGAQEVYDKLNVIMGDETSSPIYKLEQIDALQTGRNYLNFDNDGLPQVDDGLSVISEAPEEEEDVSDSDELNEGVDLEFDVSEDSDTSDTSHVLDEIDFDEEVNTSDNRFQTRQFMYN